MRRPLIIPLIGLITGIVIGNYFEIPYRLLLIGLIFILALLFLAQRKRWRIAGFSLIFCFALIGGILNSQRQQYVIPADQSILRHVDSGRKTVEGIIVESPFSYPDKKILIVRCLRILKDRTYIPVAGDIRLVIPAAMSFSYGDYIRFHSVLKKIHNFNNPGGFNFEQYLTRQGIYAAGFVANEAGIILLRAKSGSSLKWQLESFRMYLKGIISKNAPSPQREIITAMTIGDQNEIPADIRDNFNKTGTSHILSISGLHIGMVAATAFFLIMLLLKSSEYLMLRFNTVKIAAAAAFVLVMLYAFIAGMGVTVIRSALMALVFLIGLILGKQRDLYNSLALAGLVILAFAPEALFDISFQLSFIAVLAIIHIVPRFSQLSFPSHSGLAARLQQGIIRYLYMTTLVCVAATIGTLPLIIFYFNRISAVTIIANLITVPLLGTAALAIAMAFVLSAFFSMTVAALFVNLTSTIVGISVQIINKLASFSWSSFSMTRPSLIEIFTFYLFLMLLVQLIDAYFKKQAKNEYSGRCYSLLKYSVLLTLIFIASDLTYLSLRDKFSADLKITAIDVGQGSSILVRFPGGENMLIDGGGFADSGFDVGKMVIAPYLYSERIGRIDTVILTHPHPDHMQGLFYVLDNFNVREVWSNGRIGEDEYQQKWHEIITQRQIKTSILSEKSPIKKIRAAEITFLWPPAASISGAKYLSDEDMNDTSLVFKIKYDSTSFLITGDISSAIENTLVNSGKDLKSDVLFVPHHGSAHSSSISFIRKVACRYALISAGKGNVFHHPHPLVMDRYKSAGVQIFRTDLDGAITITSDGTKLLMETFVKPISPQR